MKIKSKEIFKKTIALMIGTALIIGTLMLPGSVMNNEFTTASAYTYEENGCTYTYNIETDRNVSTLIITEVSGYGETLEMPTTIVHEGKEYNVDKIDSNFLLKDTTIRKIIFPKKLKYVGYAVLKNSSVESITLPDTLEDVDSNFAAYCKDLKEVNYTGTKIKGENLSYNILESEKGSPLYNEKGALCFGNWLLDYDPPKEVTSVKIADLGNNGIKIENIGQFSTKYNSHIDTIDLEGIEYIGYGAFNNYDNLNTLLNDEEVGWVADSCFNSTPWYKKAKNKELIQIGKTIIYYKSDEKVLDLTKGKFADTKHVCAEALEDCENLDTILCYSDCCFDGGCFYVANKRPSGGSYRQDPLPSEPEYNIKEVYVDGKKLSYELLLEDTDVYEWFKSNITTFDGSVLTRTMVEEKTKELFDELDITYYGENNDMIGTLTPTEEFYIRLKIHDYMSLYDYDHHHIYHGFVGAFLLGGRVTCTQYAQLVHYFLECAGVEAKTNFSDPDDSVSYDVHFWNATKIGDEWFLSDDGWNAQNNNHSYGWFMNSYTAFHTSVFHEYMYLYDSFHVTAQYLNSETITAERSLGDINGDDKRDNDDVEILWDYIKGKSTTINKHIADINFDDNVDVSDAVLLDHLVNGKAVDIENIPIDGLAPTVQVAFLNGEDYDNIKYFYTERGGYITLPDGLFNAPEGKRLSYDAGMVGQRVRITDPCTVVKVKWIDSDTPDYSEPESSLPESSSKPESSLPDDSSRQEEEKIRLGDVNNDRTIDIEDAVAIIQHINGMTPLRPDEEKRADVSGDGTIDIDDAVIIISYINGNSTF